MMKPGGKASPGANHLPWEWSKPPRVPQWLVFLDFFGVEDDSNLWMVKKSKYRFCKLPAMLQFSSTPELSTRGSKQVQQKSTASKQAQDLDVSRGKAECFGLQTSRLLWLRSNVNPMDSGLSRPQA